MSDRMIDEWLIWGSPAAIEVIVAWMLFGVICLIVAWRKQRNIWGWFLSGAVLGPLGIVFLGTLPRKKNHQKAECESTLKSVPESPDIHDLNLKIERTAECLQFLCDKTQVRLCPVSGKQYPAGITICPLCGALLTGPVNIETFCPECALSIRAGAKRCEHCGKVFDEPMGIQTANS